MIYNKEIINVVLHVYDYYGETIRFDIERLEEALNDENHYLLEECYLFVQAMKLGLYDAMIFDEDIDRHGYITYLIEEHQFKEDEAVFMVAICQNIINKMGYYFEIPEFLEMLKTSYENNDLDQLSIIARTYFEGFGVSQDYEKAYEIYSYLYGLSYESGAAYLGYMCEYGLGVPLDEKQAYFYYSHTHDDLCLYYLGLMYLHGKYVEKDEEKALECFLKSEYDDAYMYQGLLLERQKKYPEAFIAYLKGAKLYQEECLFKTGEYLVSGLGVEKNVEEAFRYFKYGYEFNQGDCAYQMAMLILDKYISCDTKVAIRLLKDATSLYNQQSCLVLARFYEFGYYVEKDINKSIYYYQKANQIKDYINKKIKEGINE